MRACSGTTDRLEDIVSMLTSLPKSAQPSDARFIADDATLGIGWGWRSALSGRATFELRRVGGTASGTGSGFSVMQGVRCVETRKRGLSSVVTAQPGSLLFSRLDDAATGRSCFGEEPADQSAALNTSSPLLSLISAPAL